MNTVLVVHHTPYHFEVALSLCAQIGRTYPVELWSNHLHVRNRELLVSECRVKLFDPDTDFAIALIVTNEVSTDGISPIVQNILQKVPVIRISHDFQYALDIDKLYLFPNAPHSIIPVDLGLDYSLRYPPHSQLPRRFLVQGNIEPRRAYNLIKSILRDLNDAVFDIVGTPLDAQMRSSLTGISGLHLHFNLAEREFQETCAASNFILPLIDRSSYPRYFESAFTTSVLVGFAHLIPFIAHRELFELYGLVGFFYEHDDQIPGIIEHACKMDTLEIQAMRQSLKIRREEILMQNDTSLSRFLLRMGVRANPFRLSSFQSIIDQHKITWDRVTNKITIPSGLVEQFMWPIIGWISPSAEPHGYIEIQRSALAEVLRPILQTVFIDIDWYQRRYMDGVSPKISAREHFVTEGYFHGALPVEVTVDDGFYLKTYPDVATAISNGYHGSGQAHFESHGFLEGRMPYEGWRAWEPYRSASDSELPKPDTVCITTDNIATQQAGSSRSWRTAEETHLTRLFELIKPDCVFDVGGNVGQYGRMLRESIGYTGVIVSFEPIPSLALQLRRLAEQDRDWYVEEVALDSSDGVADFYVMNSDQFSSLKQPSLAETTLFQGMNVVNTTIRVQKLTIKSCFERLQSKVGFSRPFLKMDTQGNDLSVFEGCGEFASHFIGLQSELAVKRIYSDSVDFAAAINVYQKAGFTLSAVVPNNEGHFPDLIEFDCIMYRSGCL